MDHHEYAATTRVKRWSCAAALCMTALVVGLSCTDDIPLGLPPIAIVRVFPDSTDLRIGHELKLQALPLDEAGTLLVGKPVIWTSATPQIATVAPDGTVQGVGSGMATINAVVDGRQGSARVRVQPAPALGLSRTEVMIQKAADGPNPPPETIEITNTGGFELEGLSVAGISYGDGADGWLAAEIESASAPTTLSLAVLADPVTQAGTYSATVTVTATDADGSPGDIEVTLSIGAGAPVAAETTGDSQNGVVATPVAVPPSLRLTDEFGNPTSGIAVSFEVTGGGGSVSGSVQETDEDGRATVGSWTLGTTAGVNTLVATPAAAAIAPLTFTVEAAPGDPAILELAAGDAQSTTVATAVAVPPAALVTDAFDNPVPGVAVTFAVTAGGGSVQGATQTTDADGIATVGGWTLGTSTSADQRLAATVQSGPLAGASVEFSAVATPDAPSSITVQAGAGQTLTVATAVPVLPAVLVRDQHANPVPGVTVTFAAGSGSGTLEGALQETDDVGTASLAGWTLGTQAGSQTVSASISIPGVDPVAITVDAVADVPFAIDKHAGDNQSATVGSAVGIPPRVRATDQYGNPVVGVEVTFAVTGGGGDISDPVQLTDTLGLAAVGSWILGPEAGAGNNTLAGTAPGLAGSPLTFTATGNPAGAENLLVESGDAQTGVVAQPLAAPYVVRVTDAFGNGVAGVVVGWEVTGGGGAVTETSTTDTDGFASSIRTLGTSTAAPHTARAVVGGLTGSPANFAATPLPDAPASITINAPSSQTAQVNTAVPTAPSVAVHDQFGNPVPAHPVAFAVTAGGGSADPVDGTVATNASGVASLAAWTVGTVAGTANNTLTATADGAGITGNPVAFTASASPGPPSPALTTTVASHDPITACQTSCSTGGGTASTIAVTVRDEFANTISGASVTITASGSANYFAGTLQNSIAGSTNASGVFSGVFNSTLAQGKTLTGTVSGMAGSVQTAVSVNAGAPSATFTTFTTSHASITACQSSCSVGSTASTLTVNARDQFNNPIPGASVTLSVTSGTTGNYFNSTLTNSSSGAANASGVFTRTFNSTGAQTKSLNAAITSGTTVNRTAGLTVNPGSPASLAKTAGDNLTTLVCVPSLCTNSITPQVRVFDAFGNPVTAGWAVTFSIGAGGGTINGATSQLVTTSSTGHATGSNWRLGETGTLSATGLRLNTLVASRTGVTSQTFNANGRYNYNTHVGPIVTGSSCSGCHGSALTYAYLYNQFATCNGSFRRVATGGGTTAESNSVLMRRMDGSTAISGCTGVMPPSGVLSTTIRNRVRGWIRNGAPQN